MEIDIFVKSSKEFEEQTKKLDSTKFEINTRYYDKSE